MIESEKIILGTLLYNPYISEKTFEILRPEMFSMPNREIFNVICKLKVEGKSTASGNEVDLINVIKVLNETKKLKSIGGASYLSGIATMICREDIFNSHALKVCDGYFRSQMLTVSQELTRIASDESSDMMEEMIKAGSMLNDLEEITDLQKDDTKEELIDRTVKEITTKKDTQMNGVPSFIPEIDEVLFGFSFSDLHIIAGRPGQGKTALALSMVNRISIVNNIPGAIFSLEMRSESLLSRLFAINGKISSSNIWRGQLSQEDLSRLFETKTKIEKAPIEIYDKYFGIDEIISKCRTLHRKGKLKYVVIDYMQLISSGKSNGNREQEVSQISRKLKLMAMSLQIPVIALSQLSRAVESRPDKKPMLSDLRESGSIEQDASTVMFCYRPSYYGIMGESGEGLDDKAFVILGKNRNGTLRDIELNYAHDLNQEWGASKLVEREFIPKPLTPSASFEVDTPF